MVPASALEGTRYSPKRFSPAASLVCRPVAPMTASAVPSALIGEGSLGQAGLGLMCAPVRACVSASEPACARVRVHAWARACASACRAPIAMSGSFFSRAIVSAFRCAAWWLQHRRTMPHAGMSRGPDVAPPFSRAPGRVPWVAARLVACCAVRASISAQRRAQHAAARRTFSGARMRCRSVPCRAAAEVSGRPPQWCGAAVRPLCAAADLLRFPGRMSPAHASSASTASAFTCAGARPSAAALCHLGPCPLRPARCTFYLARCKLYVARCKLHAACCKLHAVTWTLHVARCML
jgi:hypothetical protein